MSDGLEGANFERIGAAAFVEAESEVLRRVAELTEQGASLSQAVDFYVVEFADIKAAKWARATDRKASSVRQSVQRARDALFETVDDEKHISQGDDVRLSWGDRSITGTVVDIDDGTVYVDEGGGTVYKLSGGVVVLVREGDARRSERLGEVKEFEAVKDE